MKLLFLIALITSITFTKNVPAVTKENIRTVDIEVADTTYLCSDITDTILDDEGVEPLKSNNLPNPQKKNY